MEGLRTEDGQRKNFTGKSERMKVPRCQKPSESQGGRPSKGRRTRLRAFIKGKEERKDVVEKTIENSAGVRKGRRGHLR